MLASVFDMSSGAHYTVTETIILHNDMICFVSKASHTVVHCTLLLLTHVLCAVPAGAAALRKDA